LGIAALCRNIMTAHQHHLTLLIIDEDAESIILLTSLCESIKY
jgi:hypothetical protein